MGKTFFKFLLVAATVILSSLAFIQAADYNLTPAIDTAYYYTDADTIRKSGYSDVVRVIGAEKLLVQFENSAPLDSAYVMVEGSNDEAVWILLSDSVLVQDNEDHAFVIQYTEVYQYYRGRINTNVGGDDTTRTVVKFRAGGKTYAR